MVRFFQTENFNLFLSFIRFLYNSPSLLNHLFSFSESAKSATELIIRLRSSYLFSKIISHRPPRFGEIENLKNSPKVHLVSCWNWFCNSVQFLSMFVYLNEVTWNWVRFASFALSLSPPLVAPSNSPRIEWNWLDRLSGGRETFGHSISNEHRRPSGFKAKKTAERSARPGPFCSPGALSPAWAHRPAAAFRHPDQHQPPRHAKQRISKRQSILPERSASVNSAHRARRGWRFVNKLLSSAASSLWPCFWNGFSIFSTRFVLMPFASSNSRSKSNPEFSG